MTQLQDFNFQYLPCLVTVNFKRKPIRVGCVGWVSYIHLLFNEVLWNHVVHS